VLALRIALFVAGSSLAIAVFDSAVRTFVVPRGTVSSLTRLVFRSSRGLFNTLARPSRSYEWRDRVMAFYAPLTLLALPAVWLLMLFGGFTAIFWALLGGDWAVSLRLSGSSLLTLGFDRPGPLRGELAAFVEATLGLGTLALLISYLPAIYGNFSRREAKVTQLSVRAGTPPTAVELLDRGARSGYLPTLDALFARWESWFVELEETHTSMGSLAFFRSPNPGRSWVTAAGALLDTAALRYALLDVPFSPQAATCLRAGFLALRAIADVFDQPVDHDPAPDDPISVTREEFEEVYDRLAGVGAPLRSDRDEAWRTFVGWRVNYDQALLALAGLVMAPYAPWSSDRSLRLFRPRVLRRRPRRAGPPGGGGGASAGERRGRQRPS
jgi:hypothetical protein